MRLLSVYQRAVRKNKILPLFFLPPSNLWANITQIDEKILLEIRYNRKRECDISDVRESTKKFKNSLIIKFDCSSR